MGQGRLKLPNDKRVAVKLARPSSLLMQVLFLDWSHLNKRQVLQGLALLLHQGRGQGT